MKTETITLTERKELQDLFTRHDSFNDLLTAVKKKNLQGHELVGWIINDMEKSVVRMKELNAKY